MDWWFKALIALAEELGSILSTHVMTHNCNPSTRGIQQASMVHILNTRVKHSYIECKIDKY